MSFVDDAVDSAEACGLANLGGQAQFRFPDGVCELYWHSLDPTDRMPGEPWPSYVRRSADEVRIQFRSIMGSVDFAAEVDRWPFLHEKLLVGVPVLDHLCFVLYFRQESD